MTDPALSKRAVKPSVRHLQNCDLNRPTGHSKRKSAPTLPAHRTPTTREDSRRTPPPRNSRTSPHADAKQAMARQRQAGSYTWTQVKSVQNLIERCLSQYMTQAEVIATLQVQADVDPALTCLVWSKLEEANPDFFLSYDVRLKLKDQVVAFNYLVEQQTRLLQKLTLALPQ